MLAERFEGGTPRLTFHLAPPRQAKRDPRTGHLVKQAYGPWVFGAFRVLAAMKGLRGTPLDPFGGTEERRMQRQLLADYRVLLDRLVAGLTANSHAAAVALAALPLEMRGFGHVLDANVAAAKAKEADLLATFDTPAPRMAAE